MQDVAVPVPLSQSHLKTNVEEQATIEGNVIPGLGDHVDLVEAPAGLFGVHEPVYVGKEKA